MDRFFQTLPTVVYLHPEEQLQITKAELTAVDFSLAVDLLNMSDHPVKKVTFAVKFIDAEEHYLFNGSEFYFSASIDLVPHGFYYVQPFSLDERFQGAHGIEIRILEYVTDGGKHSYSTDQEKPFSLPIIPEAKQEKIQSALGPEIKTYGENLMDSWRCVCGAINPKKDQECRNCKRNKNFVLNNLTEPLINAKLLNLLEHTKETNEDNSNLKPNLTQTHLTKIAPPKDRLLRKRINQTPVMKKDHLKRSFRGFFVFIMILLACFFLLILFNLSKTAKNNRDLKKAEQLLQEGQYEAALKKYENVAHHDDVDLSQEIQQIKNLMTSQKMFERGNQSILKDQYLEAVTFFKQVIPEDKINYSKAEENIANLETIILDEVETYFREQDSQKALRLVGQYLQIVPESANALALQKNIEENRQINSHKSTEEYEEESPKDDDRAKMSEKAKNLLHSYQKVVTEKANLRSDPDVDSSIVTVLPRDSDLYIKETKIEGSVRIWCQVEAKNSKTEEIFEGWISNKVMEKEIQEK
ncbi:MAG: SH3 domain-containing protein [Tissierellia bacterium]|nr:SH3 domain-containing protein [Tissierellia bacterium]